MTLQLGKGEFLSIQAQDFIEELVNHFDSVSDIRYS